MRPEVVLSCLVDQLREREFGGGALHARWNGYRGGGGGTVIGDSGMSAMVTDTSMGDDSCAAAEIREGNAGRFGL
jgi:hypothetical protein